MDKIYLNRLESYLLVSFASLVAMPLLYILRFLDDNTLTSWRWVFTEANPGILFLYFIPLLLMAAWLSKSLFPDRYSSLFLFSGGFITTAFLWSTPEMLLDASRYFLQAKYLSENGPGFFWKEWGHTIEPWTDLPLVPFFYGILFKVFGEFRFVVQVFNSLLFAFSLSLTYHIGKILWDEETGFHAGLLILGIPYLPTQVPLMLVDIGAMFFIMLTIYSFLKAIQEGGPLWLGISVLSIVCALSTKYSTWPMLAGILPIITIVFLRKSPAAIIRRSLIISFFAAILWIVVFFNKFDIISEQIAILGTFQRQGLTKWQEGYISTFFFQIHPLITMAALYGIYRAARNRELNFLVVFCFVGFVFPLQIKRIRYIIPLLPLFTLMAAYGFNGIKDHALKRFCSYCAVLSAMVILFGAYKPFLQQTSMVNLKKAGQYLDTLPFDTIEVRLIPQHESAGSTAAALPILDLYTKKELRLQHDWPGLSIEDQHKKLSSLRFTWELSRPHFYHFAEPNGTGPQVIISSRDPGELPNQNLLQKNQVPVKKFYQQTQVFRYRTVVAVISP
jgi:hypothetical protein